MSKFVTVSSLNDCLESNSPFCRVEYEEQPREYTVGARQQTSQKTDLHELYDSFVKFYGNPMMAKYKHMNGGLCAYLAKTKSGLQFESRVIVAICPEDELPMGSLRPLENIHWVNFQTRTLQKEIPHREFIYPETKSKLMNSTIQRVSKSDLKSVYTVEGYSDLRVSLHRRRESIRDWSNTNKLFVALNEFCCSVDIV